MSQAEAEAVAAEAPATTLPEQQAAGNGAEVEQSTSVEQDTNNKTDAALEESKAEGSSKSEESKVRVYDNGVLKTSARTQEDPRKNSKYDPSVLPETDDPKKIRAQVGITNLQIYHRLQHIFLT